MIEFSVLYRLVAAIGIGLIIGMQREHTYGGQSDRHPAGVRTFTLVGLGGAMAAYLSALMGGTAPFVSGFVVLGLLLMASHLRAQSVNAEVTGITTSVALVVVYLLGGLCWHGKLLESCVIMIVILWVLTV